jgi:XTP/dITP diphosphohydrolase
MKIIFATNNSHKISEITSVIDPVFKLSGLAESGIYEDIPENESTLEGNALAKARYVYKLTGSDVFADDTGLEVDALDNEPGVLSARYAGDQKDSNDNIDKLLDRLKSKKTRKARFRTIIALILDGQEYIYEGIVTGEIIKERRGKNGFGYDPVFKPDGYNKTFAEMELEEKNIISHRARAVSKLSDFLSQLNRQ